MKRGMIRYLLTSWILLLYVDRLMQFNGFARVHKTVREQMVGTEPKTFEGDGGLSHAVDLACVFYFKQVLCLQRSAVLAVLLRRNGRAAEMVIGAQLLPFLSHAWVELDGSVINDKPYVTEIFQVLDRC